MASPIFRNFIRRLSHLSPYGRSKTIGVIIVITLVYFNVLPIVAVVVGSFFSQDVALFESFTTANWVQIYRDALPVLINTIIYAVGAALLTTVLSTIIGFLISRVRVPLSNLYFYLFLSIYFAPPVVWERVWIYLLGNNGIYPNLLGYSFNIYSLEGMIIVQGIRFIPFGLIILRPVFNNMDSSLEEAAQISGSNLPKTLRDISLPIMRPGIWTVFILVLIISLGSFRVPLVIGLPERVVVLPTFIWEAAKRAPIQNGVMFAGGTLLVLISIPLLYLYYKIIGATSQYATVSGEGYTRSDMDLGRWEYVLSGIVGVFTFLSVVVPILLLVYMSLTPYYVSPLSGIVPPLTLENFFALPEQRDIVSSVVNSASVALVSTMLLLFAALLLSWIVAKSEVRYRTLIDYLSFLPIGVPSVALSVGFIFLYLQVIPINIYGTLTILVLAYTTRYLPSTMRIVYPSVVQIHDELLDASKMAGAGIFRTIYSIISPLVVDALRAVFSMRFALILLEMPIAMMLRAPGNTMISTRLFELDQDGQFSTSAALGVVVMATLILLAVIVHNIGGDHLD